MDITFKKIWLNPLYFILNDIRKDETIRTVLIMGGKSCFDKNQCVITEDGEKPISEIRVGEKVLSFNELTKEKEYKRVENVFKFDNKKPVVKIKLKSGEEIICTDDHKFYYKGEWICIKHLLSLWDEKNNQF